MSHMQDYTYWSISEVCNSMREGRKVVSINNFEDVPSNSEADLAKAVTAQPVSVAICASALQFYSSGTFPQWRQVAQCMYSLRLCYSASAE